MRIAYSLGSLLTVNQVLECSEILSHTNVDTIWIPETWGMENFSMLSMVSQKASKPKIGSSIINIYSRKIFNLKNFTLLIKPHRVKIPIYLAAVNQKMIDLTWEVSDGVIFYLRPLNEMTKTIQKMQSKRKIDVTCQIISCVSNDAEIAIIRAKQALAFYISVGKICREVLSKNGFETETRNIFDEFKKSGFESNHELISDNMLKSLTIAGTPDQCITQLQKFRETGIDLPTIQFNPVGNVTDSFKLFTNTFSEEQ